jgi:polyribonucleotide nucleotidyltransferase
VSKLSFSSIKRIQLISTNQEIHGFNWFSHEKILIKNSELELGNCKFRMGHLTEASVIGKAGGTLIHATLASKTPDDEPNEDFLPLTVDYRNRSYAFGKMPRTSKRREKHGDDDEILVARVVDRAIRPLFPKGYVNEVQLTITSHAVDGVHDPTVIAVNAASYALMESKQPWYGPIGCVRVGMVNNKFVVNPTVEEMKESNLDLLYAGTMDRTVMYVFTYFIHLLFSYVNTRR